MHQNHATFKGQEKQKEQGETMKKLETMKLCGNFAPTPSFYDEKLASGETGLEKIST